MAAILAAACLMFVGCDQPTGGEKPAETPAEKPAETPAATYEIKDVAYVVYDLPASIASADKIKVDIKGENKGSTGFRVYLVKDKADVNKAKDIYVGFKSDGADYKEGAFEISFELEASDAADGLMVKGPAYGTNIDDVVLSSVKVDGTDIDVTTASKAQ